LDKQMTTNYLRPYLKQLEAEAIFVLREVAAQCERPVLLFSGGKDSIVLVELARRAFAPGRIPFPLLHIDTGHNFPEALEFRDELAERHGVQLIVRYVQDSIDRGRVVEESGPHASRNGLQTVTLLDALNELRVDVALGGARRDEEKARAKERFFSHRDRFGQWDPKNQRPELWSLFNGHKHLNEHFRVFPLSNWTELDIWHYIRARTSPCPRSTTPTTAPSPGATACCWRICRTRRSRRTRRATATEAHSSVWCASAQWVTSPAPARSNPPPPHWMRSSPRSPRRASPSAPDAATTSAQKLRWKTANVRGTSKWNFCALPRPAVSTTAKAR
jgi:3'-phosphoadenosine 5'-phosphosulfate sulfotransferase (PAPS reductase)/FAD synthetase